jgi:hypothetical protein
MADLRRNGCRSRDIAYSQVEAAAAAHNSDF